MNIPKDRNLNFLRTHRRVTNDKRGAFQAAEFLQLSEGRSHRMTLRNLSISSSFHRRFSSIPLRSFARHSLVINHSSSSFSSSSSRPSRRGLYSSGRQTEAVWPRAALGQRYIKPTPSRVLSTRQQVRVGPCEEPRDSADA